MTGKRLHVRKLPLADVILCAQSVIAFVGLRAAHLNEALTGWIAKSAAPPLTGRHRILNQKLTIFAFPRPTTLGEDQRDNAVSNVAPFPEQNLLREHVRQAARLREYAAGATTAGVKARLLEEAAIQDRLAEEIESGLRAATPPRVSNRPPLHKSQRHDYYFDARI
jgi:hypothetical protein